MNKIGSNGLKENKKVMDHPIPLIYYHYYRPNEKIVFQISNLKFGLDQN